jgi:nucleoside-diphosphate-sugar epimerase
VILYNGATGGLGRYLAPAISRRGEPSHIIAARLADQAGLKRELDAVPPHGPVTFIHLAARVSVPACEADPAAAREINVSLARSTTLTVIRWASLRDRALRVIYVSTGHVYAARGQHSRLTEEDDTGPRSVYARTKLEAERELASVATDHGVPFLTARVFGLLAPRQAPNYVLPGLIERVRTRDLGFVQGLDFVRDYMDARDVCEDLLLLAAAEWPSGSIVLNVCSGVPVSIRQLLRVVIGAIAPDTAEVIARSARSAPGRPDDVQWLVGDPSRFVSLTGVPSQRIPLLTSVRDAVAEAMHG